MPQSPVTDSTLILVTDHATMRGDIMPFAEFARANASDPYLLDDVRCLARGMGFTIGGGAAPAFSISRWSA